MYSGELLIYWSSASTSGSSIPYLRQSSAVIRWTSAVGGFLSFRSFKHSGGTKIDVVGCGCHGSVGEYEIKSLKVGDEFEDEHMVDDERHSSSSSVVGYSGSWSLVDNEIK